MYEPHYEEESGGGGFLIGLLCGTALGAAIGLMFAPKAGSEFRQRLYESTGDIRRKAYETYDQASEQVNNMVSKGVRPWTAAARLSSRPGSRRPSALAATAVPPISAARIVQVFRISTPPRARPAAFRCTRRAEAESREQRLLFDSAFLSFAQLLSWSSLSLVSARSGIARALWPASA